MQMQGKTAIVTGAARGLGRAYAEALAKEGANVVAGDVRDCNDTVSAITKAGGKAISVSLDVADLASPGLERIRAANCGHWRICSSAVRWNPSWSG